MSAGGKGKRNGKGCLTLLVEIFVETPNVFENKLRVYSCLKQLLVPDAWQWNIENNDKKLLSLSDGDACLFMAHFLSPNRSWNSLDHVDRVGGVQGYSRIAY